MGNIKKPGCLWIAASWISFFIGAFVIAGALVQNNDALAHLNLQTVIGMLLTSVPVIVLRLSVQKEKDFWPWAFGWLIGISVVVMPSVHQNLRNPGMAILFIAAVIPVIIPIGLLLEHSADKIRDVFEKYLWM